MPNFSERRANRGLVLKVILSFADLFIGVPSGPYHLAMVAPNLPVAGLWIEHLPSWYDEPKEASIHVISRNIQDKQLNQRPGSFASRGALNYRMTEIESRSISGERAFDAVQALL
jgi:ADP-heptose:LPS heptosyltransferase